jgi:hypothetical protein
MKTVKVYKAQSLTGIAAEGIIIEMTEELPDSAPYGIMYDDAAALADILHRTLPGATFDLLAADLLDRVASSLRVAHGHAGERNG